MYLATGDINNTPVGRAELVRQIFKKYNTLGGKLFGPLAGAKSITDEDIEKLWIYYYQCTQCRRCSVFCPIGIDQADTTRAVRQILYELGYINKYIGSVLDAVGRVGNNLGIPPKAARNILQYAVREIKEENGVEIPLKIDEPAEALLVPPSGDFFANIETLKGYIWFLYVAGVDFTFGTTALELGNFGLFVDERHMAKAHDWIINTARKLDVKYVIAGECGHGWRAFKNHTTPRLKEVGIESFHILHMVVEAIKSGKLKLDPERNGEDIYVYQDPCNCARAGDLVDEPRFILNHVVKNWRNSWNHKEKSFCCGAGAGLLTDEIMELRMLAAMPAFTDAMRVAGRKFYIVRPCAIDKAQFSHVLPYLNKMFGTDVKVIGVMDLVYRALLLP